MPIHDDIREQFRLSSGSVFTTSPLLLSTERRWSGRSLTGEKRSGTGMSMWVAEIQNQRRVLLSMGVGALSVFLQTHAIDRTD